MIIIYQLHTWIYKQIELISKKFKFSLDDPIKKIPKKGMNAILYGIKDEIIVENKSIGVNIDYLISFEGISNFIVEQYQNNDSIRLKRWANNYFKEILCDSCKGSRLKKEALYFKIDDKNINEIVNLEIKDLGIWFKNLPSKLNDKQKIISEEIIKEISERIKFLDDVGLGYLTLNRSSKSLSGGESQRIRLASQIGSQLELSSNP